MTLALPLSVRIISHSARITKHVISLWRSTLTQLFLLSIARKTLARMLPQTRSPLPCIIAHSNFCGCRINCDPSIVCADLLGSFDQTSDYFVCASGCGFTHGLFTWGNKYFFKLKKRYTISTIIVFLMIIMIAIINIQMIIVRIKVTKDKNSLCES